MSARPSSPPDPYCGFKDDRWRFYALAMRCVCGTVVAAVCLVVLGPASVVAGALALGLRQWLSKM